MITSQKKGFTLIELLVVIAIIGLLSTVAVVSLGAARAKARDAKRIADVKQISTALEQYYADKASYPANAASGGATSGLVLGDTTTTTLTDSGWGTGTTGTVYMGRIPPVPGTAVTPCAATAAGTPTSPYINNYCYFTTTTSAATDYKMTIKLESTNPSAGITATNCVFSSSGMSCT
jgi:prepilin-type N-terminal cleavage/methylation domain-containing protein